MLRLGVTGGIGSGKSYVCRMLNAQYDIPVYYCDVAAAILVRTNLDVINRLSELIPDVYTEDGEFDKQRMSDYLFRSPDNASRVNQIIHPAVREDLRQWFSQQTSKIAVMESAILYESGFQDEVDKVLFVDAPDLLRLERAMQRDGATEQLIRERMNLQQPQVARSRADYIVSNTPDTNLQEQLDKIIKELV